MVKFFQGGYDEAKLYTKTSSKKIKPVCPDCGRVKSSFVSISNMYANHSIHCPCSDGVSYPEKFMFYLLENLDIKFFMQPNTNVFKWSKGFRYDFYIPKLNCIIETHGEQHYIEKTAFAKKLKEQQEDDRLKEQLARDNGIKYYIVLDCRKSDLDWVKNSILNSELAKLFDLSKIDWLKFGEISYSNLIKKVCAIKKNNPNLTSTDISKLMKLSSVTILKYLKKGTKLGWCNYNPKEESAKAKEKSAKMAKERNSKIVEIFKDDKSLGIFDSGHELARQSEKLFGVKLDNKHISDVCLGRRCHHRGFTFKYV